MVIVVINQGLEVSNFDLLPASLTLHQGVQLQLGEEVRRTMLLHQLLNYQVTLQVVRGQTQNVKSLFLGDKSAFNSESLFSDLFSAFVAKLLHLALQSLPLEELKDLFHAFLGGQGSDEAAEENGLRAVEGVFH